MRYLKPVNVQEVLENSSLAKLMEKGIQLQQINEYLILRFPSQFNGLYRVINKNDETLVIEVANAMVRQSLLFQKQKLLTLIQQHFPQIQSLKFKINPALQKV